ncbi:MAG: hypothetical protein LBU76_04220 [Azoarcus sp.]|jgi:hypothetical protein|nr:hypothetical protein [Azoarcus sp.]
MAKKNKSGKSKNSKADKRMAKALCAAMAAGGNGKNGFGGFNGNGGFLRGIGKLLPSRKSERFLMGLLIGAGAAYLLSDENLRGKLIKSAMKAYAGLAGGFEEIKEQIADYKAELEAELQDADA